MQPFEAGAPLFAGDVVLLVVEQREVEMTVGEDVAGVLRLVDRPKQRHPEHLDVEVARPVRVLRRDRNVLDPSHAEPSS